MHYALVQASNAYDVYADNLVLTVKVERNEILFTFVSQPPKGIKDLLRVSVPYLCRSSSLPRLLRSMSHRLA
jgi:hypothetical protein